MNETSLVVNTDYLSYPEAAEQLGVTPSAISHWTTKYPEFQDEYVSSRHHKGRKRKVISSRGLFALAAMKDTDRGGRYKKSEPKFTNQQIKKARLATARKALEEPKPRSLSELKIAIQQQLEMIEQMEKQGVLLEETTDKVEKQKLLMETQGVLVEETTHKVDNHEDRISDLEGDTSKMSITTGQRKLLHEKINFLHYTMKEKGTHIQQSAIWGKVHNYTGRKAIGEYLFEDYKVARSFLKDVFKKLDIEW